MNICNRSNVQICVFIPDKVSILRHGSVIFFIRGISEEVDLGFIFVYILGFQNIFEHCAFFDLASYGKKEGGGGMCMSISRTGPGNVMREKFKLTQRNLFEILLNQSEIRLYLQFSG